MIYDKLPVALLSALATQDEGSTNSLIAHYLLAHLNELDNLSVKELAARCHVGAGTVSRFAREAGFQDFSELKEACARTALEFQTVGGSSSQERAEALAKTTVRRVLQAAHVDLAALRRLAEDLWRYRIVTVLGMLKAQAAAIALQMDLLAQGRFAGTLHAFSAQVDHIATAREDELVVIFSYTGSYFDACDLDARLHRLDRPKIWMVCGSDRPLPPFVADRVLFASTHDQLGHPYQLLYVAGLIAQEYASLANAQTQ